MAAAPLLHRGTTRPRTGSASSRPTSPVSNPLVDSPVRLPSTPTAEPWASLAELPPDHRRRPRPPVGRASAGRCLVPQPAQPIGRGQGSDLNPGRVHPGHPRDAVSSLVTSSCSSSATSASCLVSSSRARFGLHRPRLKKMVGMKRTMPPMHTQNQCCHCLGDLATPPRAVHSTGSGAPTGRRVGTRRGHVTC